MSAVKASTVVFPIETFSKPLSLILCRGSLFGAVLPCGGIPGGFPVRCQLIEKTIPS